MKDLLGISTETWDLYEKAMQEVKEMFLKVDEICEYNSAKVMAAFFEAQISEAHFDMTTGYGYNDLGREKVEEVYAKIFQAESALVRNQFISGSHALAKTLFGLLRPNDLLLSINGLPYDTLQEVIGIQDNPSSLKSYGVIYHQIDLKEDDFDYSKITEFLNQHTVKVVMIQRSRGYASRKSLSIEKCEEVISLIKKVSPKTIVMVDNCYCEFVTKKEPTQVGADVVVGSLIKNLGGGLAPNGGYVVGKKEYIDFIAEALTLPGEGREVGPSLGANKVFLQGLFLAPSVVASALKTSILTSAMLKKLNYQVEPEPLEERVDIVEKITFGNRKDLISYCEGIQSGSPIDSFAKPIPIHMPGYQDEIIMACGAFTQGSSIELSCDGPLRSPFSAFQQGGLTFDTAKVGILKAIDKLIEGRNEE